MAGGVGWVEPFGDEHRRRRCIPDPLVNGREFRLHLVDDGAASLRHPEQVGQREDAVADLGECLRVERNDLGVRYAELADSVGGDGADGAEILGQDQVGLQSLEQFTLDCIQRASPGRPPRARPGRWRCWKGRSSRLVRWLRSVVAALPAASRTPRRRRHATRRVRGRRRFRSRSEAANRSARTLLRPASATAGLPAQVGRVS
jgi:hypothetical protein